MESRKQERPCWGGKQTLREGEEASRCDRRGKEGERSRLGGHRWESREENGA